MKRLILKTSYREGILIPLTLSDEMVVALLEATKVKHVEDHWEIVAKDSVEIVFAELETASTSDDLVV